MGRDSRRAEFHLRRAGRQRALARRVLPPRREAAARALRSGARRTQRCRPARARRSASTASLAARKARKDRSEARSRSLSLLHADRPTGIPAKLRNDTIEIKMGQAGIELVERFKNFRRWFEMLGRNRHAGCGRHY